VYLFVYAIGYEYGFFVFDFFGIEIYEFMSLISFGEKPGNSVGNAKPLVK